MLLNSLFLSISSSIDSLGIGITYGIKNTKISFTAKFIIFMISFFISFLSIYFGNIIKNLLHKYITKAIANLVLIFMGFFICFQSLKKEDTNHINTSNINETKIYSFFIKFLGITIKIIKDPVSSDLDNSHLIDSKESIFLGLALSLDSFGIGICGGAIGITSIFFPLLVSILQLVFLVLGNLLGKGLYRLRILPDNIWSITSGLLLILIGTFRFLY